MAEWIETQREEEEEATVCDENQVSDGYGIIDMTTASDKLQDLISEAEPHNTDERGWGPLTILSFEGDNMKVYLQVARTMMTEDELLKINTQNILREEVKDIVNMRTFPTLGQCPERDN